MGAGVFGYMLFKGESAKAATIETAQTFNPVPETTEAAIEGRSTVWPIIKDVLYVFPLTPIYVELGRGQAEFMVSDEYYPTDFGGP